MKITRMFVPALLGVMATMSSCQDKLEYNEYAVYDRDYITLNFGNVGGFMTDLYNAVDYDFGNYSGGAMRGSASDESQYSRIGNAIDAFYNGAWSPTNPKANEWYGLYKSISTANHFLDQFQGLKFEELVLNSDYGAQLHRYQNYPYEVRFLRAYYYFMLVRQYGDVPLVTRPMSGSELNQLKRNPSDEVFQYIFDECDAIKDSIIADYADLGSFALGQDETGRADRYAVLALKARAALYWASPLFNPSGDKERYRTAALYSKELIDAATAAGKGLTAAYQNLWADNNFSKASIAKEILFGRRYYKAPGGDNLVESNNYPVGIEGGRGGNCPTQNLVDAYDMKTTGIGIFEEGSGYDPAKPYTNRDPRLALTVACNGDKWPTYQTDPLETFEGGAHGQPLAGATTTGYYLRKLCNGGISLASNGRVKEARHTWLVFRLGEVYLNYAEAVFKYLGSADQTSAEFTMSAREAANMTRKRAKMPDLKGTDADFWERLQKERMVELAFEGHRFWDVRRWKEADKFFKNIISMQITKDPETGALTYTRKTTVRQWNDKMYLFPLPQSEIAKNPNLTQTPGW